MADFSVRSTPPAEVWEELRARTERDVAAAEQTLRNLAETYSPEGLFAAAFLRLVVTRASEVSDALHGTAPAKLERLAFHLWRCERAGQTASTPEAVGRAVEAADTLVVSTLLGQAVPSGQPRDELDWFMRHVLIDAHVVRGSAYPEQTADEILGIAGQFDARFAKTLGSTVTDLVHCVWSIAWAQEAKINVWLDSIREDMSNTPGVDAKTPNPLGKKARRRATRHARRILATKATEIVMRDALRMIPVSREDCRQPNGEPPTEGTWRVLLDLVGLTPQVATALNDVLLARTRPLFIFHDDRVLVGDVSNTLDCLWDAIERQASADQDIRARYKDVKAEWLEARTTQYLARVFGDDAVFRNLRYPEPDRPGERAEAELDAVVRWGPFLFLIEAKARQFRLKGLLGDVGRLRDDLKANVEDAFQQALRARRYLMMSESATFREARTGRTLQVRHAELERVYLITVSLHFLGGAATRLAKLRPFGLLKGSEYPWAISISELDLITQFAEGPDVFLHYLDQRQQIEQASQFPNNDDLDLFGAYLSTRLNSGDFAALAPNADFVWLAEFQEPFDRWMDAKRRGQPLPSVRLEMPEAIREVLKELRLRKDDWAAPHVAIALLDLSRRELEMAGTALAQAREQRPAPGMYRRLTLTLGDLAFSTTIAIDGPLSRLEERTVQRTLLEKYRRRTSRSIGFGIHLGEPPRAFHAYAWSEGAWDLDPELERQLRDETVLVAPGQVPGRNDPCICGSGQKFKRCCLSKIR